MSERSSRIRQLRERRDELAASLPALDKERADTVRERSYTRARDRAGVTSYTAEQTAALDAKEAAAHAAMRDVRVEMHRLDAEIESEPRGGFAAPVGRALRRLRNRG
jgi:hypothetical protein